MEDARNLELEALQSEVGHLKAEMQDLQAKMGHLLALMEGVAAGTEQPADAPGAKETLTHLKAAAQGRKSDEETPRVGHVQKMPHMSSDPAVMDLLGRLEDACGEQGDSGRIAYLGVFASGGRQSTWMRNGMSVNGLLELIESHAASQMLACIGSDDRLNMLMALLRKPRTVAQLVEECGYSSTGQVYHHLRPLIAADLVEDGGKGCYAVRSFRVQGIVMLLAGIYDLVHNPNGSDN